ncbi:RagB/SusD family nutrient uptake outer membrane protein [Parabacteroides sp. PF5-9]|uniref:RagB/SusD family nutrient uptake outer membrane protein n=1 Tax=Parabacteroides sp. PF5-9 TaxID=1742404 RepID=UPI0024730270|nr:RagB/SusD family nutrient uptake outer membrane protein [Parabacteroides sp. PF5-9]MDH6358901.1 hypothetical protein [Parabacteroides sp. PF5-9]
MKKIYVYIIAAVTLSMTACSDFLTVDPVGAVGESSFTTKEGVDQLLNGMYGATLYRNSAGNALSAGITNYTYGDVLGGQANKGSAASDQPAFTSLEVYTVTVDNAYLQNKWNRSYDGVYRANSVISTANKIQEELSAVQGESKDFYTEAIAQARFMRGLSHFEVVKLYGAAVPYVGDEDYEASVNPQVSNVDEGGNYIYIWDKIIADFQYAYDNLPNVWTSDKGLPNKWAAAAFLAKAMLYQSSPYDGLNGTSPNYAAVRSLLETIIANGVDNNNKKFQLAETYESLWTAGESDWTGESVFDVQTVISGTQATTNSLWGDSNTGMTGALGTGGWGFYQPSYEMVNSHIVNADGLPLLDKSYQSMNSLTQVGEDGHPVTDLTVYTDPRLDVTVGRFNVPYMDWSIPTTIEGWIREPSNGGYYMNKKPQPRKADKGSLSINTVTSSTAKNYHMIRYADVLLMYAECLIETGDLQEARTYINQIRARAANGYISAVDAATMEPATSSYVLEDLVTGTTKPNAAANYRIGLYPESQFTSKEDALAALRFERKIELGLEGHWWYDLVRWGIVVNEINNFLKFESQHLGKYSTAVYNSKWYTMPLPYNQIVKMEGLLVQDQRWQ